MRQAKFHTIVYGEPVPEVGSQFEKTDCLIVVQKEESGTDVDILYADGNGKVVSVPGNDNLLKLDLSNAADDLTAEQKAEFLKKITSDRIKIDNSVIQSIHKDDPIKHEGEKHEGENLSVGYENYQKLEGGVYNISLMTTMQNLVRGSWNVGIGAYTLNNLVEGTGNIASGNGALNSLKRGSVNTASGYVSLFNLVEGTGNVAFGTQAGTSLKRGNDNEYIGNNAGYYALNYEGTQIVEEENHVIRIGGFPAAFDETKRKFNYKKTAINPKATKIPGNGKIFGTFTPILINKEYGRIEISSTLFINPRLYNEINEDNRYNYFLIQNEEGEVNRENKLEVIKSVLLSDDFTLTEEEQTKLKQKLGINV